MSILIAILTLALVAAVVVVISAPLRSAARRAAERPTGSLEPVGVVQPEELEAAREAKYREIRDAELDYRTGKLSREDYEAIDSELRGEAIEILDRLEAGATEPPPGPTPRAS
ncbi:MAG TPA: hypothetical protein VGO14_00295 [Solirubrobacteraceae bacterium]|nr:hypothetical protein [Solirubrobacteraceae bacterium]